MNNLSIAREDEIMLMSRGLLEQDLETGSQDNEVIDSEKAELFGKILEKYGQAEEVDEKSPKSESPTGDQSSHFLSDIKLGEDGTATNQLTPQLFNPQSTNFMPAIEVARSSPDKEQNKEEDEGEVLDEDAGIDLQKYVPDWEDPSTRAPKKRSQPELSKESFDTRPKMSNDVADFLMALAGGDKSESKEMSQPLRRATEVGQKNVTPEQFAASLYRQVTVTGAEIQKKETLKLDSMAPSMQELPSRSSAFIELAQRTSEIEMPHARFAQEEEKKLHKRTETLHKNEFNYPPTMKAEGSTIIRHKRPKILDQHKLAENIPDDTKEPEEVQIRKYFSELQDQKNKKVSKDSLELESQSEEELLEEKKDDESPAGSLNSTSTETVARNLHSLRDAIDEKFVPVFIKRINYSALGMLLVLVGLSLVFFIYELQLYKSDMENIEEISYSEKRKDWLIDINLRLRELILLNMDLTEKNESLSVVDNSRVNTKEMQITTQTLLKVAADNLLNTQSLLSLKIGKLTAAEKAKINLNSVDLVYLSNTPLLPAVHRNTVWQAVLEIVVGSFRIANMTIDEINMNQTAVFLVAKNSLNSVYLALQNSTLGIMGQIKDRENAGLMVLLMILLVSSGTIMASLLFLPGLHRARSCKERVLLLLCELRKEDVREYQLKCERFKLANVAKVEREEVDKEDMEESIADVTPEGGNKDRRTSEEFKMSKGLKLTKSITKNEAIKQLNDKKLNKSELHVERKYKKIASNFMMFTINMLMVISLVEGYFLLAYFYSTNFIGKVSHLVDELTLVFSRAPTHSFLLLIQNTTIEFKPAQEFVADYHRKMYDQEERLLDIFAKNRDFHTNAYNKLFQDIIFSNFCAINLDDLQGNAIDSAECEEFNKGILKQGLYTSVIKYWDYLRQLNSDFFTSKRTRVDIREFLNAPELQVVERLENYYFKAGLNRLGEQLESDVSTLFKSENKRLYILFFLFIFAVMLAYLILWKLFLTSLMAEHWKAKSLLSIVSPEKVMANPQMRNFIVENSSVLISGEASSNAS